MSDYGSLMIDLQAALVEELGTGGGETLELEGATLLLETLTLGFSRRAEVYDAQRRRADAPHDGLDRLLHLLARHRVLNVEGEVVPDIGRIAMSPATRAIVKEHDLWDAVHQAWLAFNRNDDGEATGHRVWRTAGRVPGAYPLTRERRGDVLQVETPHDAPWLSGRIAMDGFEITTLADRKGRFLIVLDGDRPSIRLPGVAETLSVGMEGRRLHEIVDYAPLKSLDLRIGSRKDGVTTVVHRLDGGGLVPGRTGNPLIEECEERLSRSIPGSRAIARRLAKMHEAWIDAITAGRLVP